MKVRESQFRITEALATAFGHPERSEGLHVSRIIHDLREGLGKGAGDGSISQLQLEEFGTIGFLWERILELTLSSMVADTAPGRFLRLGEVAHDGLFLTPDYCDLDYHGDGSNVLGLEEWKCSWSSPRKADDLEKNFWHWLVQIKAYCWVLETRLARLRAVFIAGDWKGDITPRCRIWEFEFTERELADNWSMLINHAKAKGWMAKWGQ